MTTPWETIPHYPQWVAQRQALKLPGYESFADVGLDGPWTTPYHLASCSPTGPLLLTYNYLDAPSARFHRDALRRDGYLAAMPFNRVLDLALALTSLTRANLYLTHVFHLLPATRSQAIAMRDIEISFDSVARHEITGRRIIALGEVSARICARHAITHTPVPHPSARGVGFAAKAQALAAALIATD